MRNSILYLFRIFEIFRICLRNLKNFWRYLKLFPRISQKTFGPNFGTYLPEPSARACFLSLYSHVIIHESFGFVINIVYLYFAVAVFFCTKLVFSFSVFLLYFFSLFSVSCLYI